MKKAFPTLLVLLMLLASCSHTKSPFEKEYYFQAMGEEGELVLTMDLDKMKEGEFKTLLPEENAIISRSQRASVSLMPKDSEVYPSPLENFVLSGGLEGNFPKVLTNTALSWSKDFQKVKGEKPRRYSNGTSLSVASPTSGLVLFTDGDYTAFYERTFSEREKLIGDEIAERMAKADVAFYSRNPKTLMDIGFELPALMLQSIEETYLMVTEVEGELFLDGCLEMESESNARAIATILKNQYVQMIRRKGEKLDTKKAAGYFTYEGNSVAISSYTLSEGMWEKMSQTLTSGLGGII